MDSTQSQYLRISQFLMSTIGQWPYQSNKKKILIQTIVMPLVFLQTFFQFCGMMAGWYANDIQVFLEDLSFVMVTSVIITKYVNYTYNHNQMKNLMSTMVDDWNIYSKSSQEEHDILCKCYAAGKKFGTYYTVIMSITVCPLVFIPGILSIADFMGWYNMTEKVLTYPLQHFLDVEKYYYYLIIHGLLASSGFVLMVIAIDSMLILNVQHESALCEILRLRLERIANTVKLDVNFNAKNKNDVEYLNAKTCITMHNHIIKYAEYLENANTTSHLFQLGFVIGAISLEIYQTIMRLNQTREVIRNISYMLCLFCGLYLESWPGQQIWDCTEKIFLHITNSKWYDFSPRTKRIISLMLLKSCKPSQMTAGKLYVLNVQNFGAVAKTCFSFCAVLHSSQ